ncbi:MAG TPA: hypothetical protein VFX16_36835 [Pseudonocardiaceae bacterium]|nr:hypothetical protein [Pseudonocardiaceae bacterium]
MVVDVANHRTAASLTEINAALQALTARQITGTWNIHTWVTVAERE